MSEGTLVSARVSEEVAERLAALAETTHRSKCFLAAQAIEKFLIVQESGKSAIKLTAHEIRL